MALKFLNDGYFAGKVGIGTESPVSIVDVSSTAPTLTIGGVALNQFESGRIRFTEFASSSGFQGSYMHYDGSTNKMHIGMHDPSNTTVGNDVNAITILRANTYVGIGTSSPSYKLSVNGNIQSDFIRGYTYPTNSFLDFDDDQTASANHTRLASVGRIAYLADTNANEPAANAAHEFFTGTSDIDTATSLMVIETGGNVGIGTTSPGTKLHVVGSNMIFKVENTSTTTNDYSQMLLQAGAASSYIWTQNQNSTNYGGAYSLNIYTQQAGPIAFFTNGNNERMRITSTGNVGIGRSTSITAALFVEGPADTSTISTSSTPAARINNGGAISNWIGSNGYNYGYIQSIQDDGSNNLKPLSLNPLGGNVGIGETNPSEKLHMKNTTGTACFIRFQNTGGSGVYIGGRSESMEMYTNGTLKMAIGSNGSVKFNSYNDANQTGTPTYLLGTDGSGNVVKTTTIPGSAAGPYLPLAGGTMTGTNGVLMPDNFKLKFGDATTPDLEIYHDGSNSYIQDTGTGTLNLQGSTQVLIGGTNGEVGVQYVENAGVGLRHNNVTKLTTESTGINVVGDIKIDSALLSNQENTDIDTGAETVASVAVATYTAAFFDFVIKKTTNVRSGTVYACHDGTNVEFTETSTQDLGDTSDVTLSVDISGGNMRLRATTSSDNWSIKSLIRAI